MSEVLKEYPERLNQSFDAIWNLVGSMHLMAEELELERLAGHLESIRVLIREAKYLVPDCSAMERFTK